VTPARAPGRFSPGFQVCQTGFEFFLKVLSGKGSSAEAPEPGVGAAVPCHCPGSAQERGRVRQRPRPRAATTEGRTRRKHRGKALRRGGCFSPQPRFCLHQSSSILCLLPGGFPLGLRSSSAPGPRGRRGSLRVLKAGSWKLGGSQVSFTQQGGEGGNAAGPGCPARVGKLRHGAVAPGQAGAGDAAGTASAGGWGANP